MNIFEELFNDEKRQLKKGKKVVDSILALEKKFSKFSDEELKNQTAIFKDRLSKGETLDDILPEAFATVREVSKRVNNEFPYPVQLLAGWVIHNGDLAEAATGSGKTCSSLAPIYLNALTGKGVHVITVNEYLSKRDAEHNGRVFNFLGLTVGVNLKGLHAQEKKDAYNCDITYTTNSELGFDYLRDNMAKTLNNRVIRELNFAIIDEADSILIDDAKTPLIISGGERGDIEAYKKADRFVKTLNEDDYDIDLKYKQICLSHNGLKKVDKFYEVDNIYALEDNTIVHYVTNALRANYIMEKDVDYLVENNELFLIEQSTGRKMEGREYSDGLNQAIQAKENIPIILETITMATITYQNFFRLYNKLAGMTGTAKTEEEEFLSIYNMRVIQIPTNEPIIRIDKNDKVFLTKKAKYDELIDDIREIHKTGQPILIGTPSVEISEIISEKIKDIPHEVLNAKNHAKEAEIIAKAGQKFAVTVATNMAGRGTDIKLGEGVKELGGLYVVGVERHESRRIDNQLRGRAGRQGDPGVSQFYVSMEDDLMVRFASDKTRRMLESFKDLNFESGALSKAITQAQETIEGLNFESRKTLLDFDEVLNKQRNIIYKERDAVLKDNKAHDFVEIMLKRNIDKELKKCYDENGKLDTAEVQKLLDNKYKINLPNFGNLHDDIFNEMIRLYKEFSDGVDTFHETEQLFVLLSIDGEWSDHLSNVSKLKDGIGFRGYAGNKPLAEYTDEAMELFEDMIDKVSDNIVGFMVNAYRIKKD